MKTGSSYQLLATVLINVIYRLYAVVDTVDPELRRLSEEAKQSVTLSRNGAHAYRGIFERRLTRGQWHSVPCLGWKEFTPSYVGRFRYNTKVCPINTVIPSMLHAVFSRPKYGIHKPIFRQNVMIENGVLVYA